MWKIVVSPVEKGIGRNSGKPYDYQDCAFIPEGSVMNNPPRRHFVNDWNKALPVGTHDYDAIAAIAYDKNVKCETIMIDADFIRNEKVSKVA